MPRADFTDVPDAGNYPVIPEGTYRLEILEIDDTADTKQGDEMWKLKLKIVDGEWRGTFIFDNLTFGVKALGKVKMLCKAVGLDTSGALDLKPSMFLHKKINAGVIADEYNGVTRNKIGFAGYSVPQELTDVPFVDKAKKDDDSDLPF